MSISDIAILIGQECDILKAILLDKNARYGNSALCPQRIFSSADNIEQIRVRIDDKLSRIKNQSDDDIEDTTLDLLGYLILLRVAEKLRDDY